MTPEELKDKLCKFIGTTNYTRMPLPWVTLLHTDGVHYLCENAQCYWLMDLIGSYQPFKLKRFEFQRWVIVSRKNKAVVTCSDGNKNILVTKRISFTDFPSGEFHLYASYTKHPESGLVIMLPSEY